MNMPTPAPPSVALLHPRLGDDRSPFLVERFQRNEYIVLEGDDLRHAQVLRRQFEDEPKMRRRSATPVTVLVALTVHLATDARTAIREITERSVDIDEPVHYVGTAAGLAGLIGDIAGIGLADGVLLRLAVPGSPEILRLVVDDVLSRLRR